MKEQVQPKYGSETGDMLMPRIDTLIKSVKEKLLSENYDRNQSSSQPRIPDLATIDKRKILDLVDILAKVNEEKDKCMQQVDNGIKEIEAYKKSMVELTEQHKNIVESLNKKIEELEDKVKKSDSKRESDTTILRTQHEIALKKISYDHSLHLQHIQTKLNSEFQVKKVQYENEIEKLKMCLHETENSTRNQMDTLVEREKMTNTIVEVLEKDKTSLETKLGNCKTKLKAAVYAIQKLKMKLEKKKSDVKSKSVQTALSYKLQKTESKDSKILKSQERLNTQNKVSEEAVISEIFFTKDSLTEILDPMFFSKQSSVQREQWWTKNKYFS